MCWVLCASIGLDWFFCSVWIAPNLPSHTAASSVRGCSNWSYKMHRLPMPRSNVLWSPSKMSLDDNQQNTRVLSYWLKEYEEWITATTNKDRGSGMWSILVRSFVFFETENPGKSPVTSLPRVRSRVPVSFLVDFQGFPTTTKKINKNICSNQHKWNNNKNMCFIFAFWFVIIHKLKQLSFGIWKR